MKWFKYVYLGFGLVFSFLLRLKWPGDFCHLDVNFFLDWINYFDPLNRLYTTQCYCNYPIVGILSSSVLLDILNGNSFHFLLILALYDAIIILLLFIFFKQLSIKYHLYWAVTVGVFSLHWTSGSFWGQIDGLGHIILLLFLIGASVPNLSRYYVKPLLLSFILAIGVLFKQLIIFSLFPIVIWVLTQYFKQKDFKSSIIFLPGTLFWILLPEIFLSTNDNYLISHLEQIYFSDKSDHINKITANGFNIWILLGWPDTANSATPLFWKFSPKNIGMIIFLIATSFTSIVLIKQILKISLFMHQVLMVLIALGLINLYFNLFLTGTHERYMIYGHIYIIVSQLILWQWLKTKVQMVQLIFSMVVSLAYGIFVIGVLYSRLFEGAHEFILLLHGVLLIGLSRSFLKISGFTMKNIQENSRAQTNHDS